MKFTKHGTAAGANAYKSDCGRFYLSSTFSTQNGKLNRPRQRWWTATDATQKDITGNYPRVVASANTVAKCRARLAKYLAAENDKPA